MSEKPSPYVSIYMARRQAEEAVKAMRSVAEGRAKSNPLWAAINTMEKAMETNGATA